MRGYLGVYAVWTRWCQGQAVDLEKATRNHVARWLLERRSLKPNSVRNGLIGVRAYYRFLHQTSRRRDDPTAGFRLPKIALPPVQPYSREDLLAFLAAGRRPRDKAMLLLLLDTGLRCSELLHIKEADIDRREATIRIYGKGGKYRLVAPGERTMAALVAYLEGRPDNIWQQGIASTSGLKTWLRRLSARAGLEGCNLHRFRHSYATAVLEAGMGEGQLQDLLGHSSSQMVRRYTEAVRRKVAVAAGHRFSLGDRL